MTGPDLLALQCVAELLPKPEQEFQFHPKRKWRIDLAWPGLMLAVECEGGVFTNGRHVRGAGFLKDIEKYNECVLRGYRLLRVTPQMIDSGEAVRLVKRAMLGHD